MTNLRSVRKGAVGLAIGLGLSLLPTAAPAQPSAQSSAQPAAQSSSPFPIDIEFGYRFLDVSGNRDVYKSQINEREGLLVRSLTLSLGDLAQKTSFVDRLRLDIGDLGTGPAGSLKLQAGRDGAYDLGITYRRAELYNALPAFANPVLESGVTPGWHTIDRVRNVFNVDLTLLPGAIVTPLVGYTRKRLSGPGTTSLTVGQDEFRLRQDLTETDQEVRVGAAFHVGPVSGEVVQGWRKSKGEETATLAAADGRGAGSGTVLGVPVQLANLSRNVVTETNTPVTTAFVTAALGPRVRVVGSYMHAGAEADTTSAEDLQGNLVSFTLRRFFGGLTETLSSRTKSPSWRGEGRVEFNITRGVDVTVGYTRRHREWDGVALLETLYRESRTFGGADPGNISIVLEARNALERTEGIFDVRASARDVGPFSFHAGWSETNQDLTVRPDPSEIVVPGGQGGDFERRLRAFHGGMAFRLGGLALTADLREEKGNNPVMRTDFVDRERLRFGASYQVADVFTIGGTAETIDTTNDRPGIGLTGRARQYAGRATLKPFSALDLHAEIGRYEADSSLPVRQPGDFRPDISVHEETADSWEGGLTLRLPKSFLPITLDAAYGRFENSGTFEFRIDRARLRADIDMTAAIGAVLEWSQDKYREALSNVGPGPAGSLSSPSGIGSLGAYRADRFGIYLRYHP